MRYLILLSLFLQLSGALWASAGAGGAPRPSGISQFSTYSFRRIPGIPFTPLPRSWDDFVVRWFEEPLYQRRVDMLRSLFADEPLAQPFATVRDDIRAALAVPLAARPLKSYAWQAALTALTTGEGKLATHTLPVTKTRFEYMRQALILEERLAGAFRPEDSELAMQVLFNLVRGFDLEKSIYEAQNALPAYKSINAESIARHMVADRVSWAEARLRALDHIGEDLPHDLRDECRRRIAAGEDADTVLKAMYEDRLVRHLISDQELTRHLPEEDLRIMAAKLLVNDEIRRRAPTVQEIRLAVCEILIERGIAAGDKEALDHWVDFVLRPLRAVARFGAGAAAGGDAEPLVQQSMEDKIKVIKAVVAHVKREHWQQGLRRYTAIIESQPFLVSLGDKNLGELMKGIQIGLDVRDDWEPVSYREVERSVDIDAASGNILDAWKRIFEETYYDPITYEDGIRGSSLLPYFGQPEPTRRAHLHDFARVLRREHEKRLGFPVLADSVRYRWNDLVGRESRADTLDSTRALLTRALQNINSMINPHDGNVICDGTRVGVMVAALNPDDDAPLALKLPFAANPLSLQEGVEARVPYDPSDEEIVALFNRVRDWSMPEVAGTRSVRAGFWESLSADGDHRSFNMGHDAVRRSSTIRECLTRTFCWIINDRDRLVPVGHEFRANPRVHINTDADARRLQRKLFFRRFQGLFPPAGEGILVEDEEKSMALVQVLRGASHCDDGLTEGINAVCALPPEVGVERRVENIVWEDIISGVHARVRALAAAEDGGHEAVESVLYLQQALKDILGLPIPRGWGIYSGMSIFSRLRGAPDSDHLKGSAGLDAMIRTVRRLRETYLNPEALIERVISLSRWQRYELGLEPMRIYTGDLESWIRTYPPLSNHNVHALFNDAQITRDTAIHLLVNMGILRARENPLGAMAPIDWDLTVHGNLEVGFRVVHIDLPSAFLDDRLHERLTRRLVPLLCNPHERISAPLSLLPLDEIYAARIAVRDYDDYRSPQSMASIATLRDELALIRHDALVTFEALSSAGADLHDVRERLRILGVDAHQMFGGGHDDAALAAALAQGGFAPAAPAVLADFADQADRDALIARARDVADTAERQAARDAVIQHAAAGHAWALPLVEEFFA